LVRVGAACAKAADGMAAQADTIAVPARNARRLTARVIGFHSQARNCMIN
jgi:hypothetical protein